MKTFTQYLKETHMKGHPEVLDDDLPDAFDLWMAELDVDEVIIYAEQWHKKDMIAFEEYVSKSINH